MRSDFRRYHSKGSTLFVVLVATSLVFMGSSLSEQIFCIHIHAHAQGHSVIAKDIFQKILGQWQRPDGGYIIAIQKVGPDGQLDASYFNPKPIYVSKAFAQLEGNLIKLFIQLDDVGYPGAIYNLLYAPERDIMIGTYYQPLAKGVFDVIFKRMNSK
jgi:hypothetical protein